MSFSEVSDPNGESKRMNLWGNALCGISSILYGLYAVLYSMYSTTPSHPKKTSNNALFYANQITGWIGISTMLLQWFMLPLLHFTGLEIFTLPSRLQMVFVLTNTLMSVLYNSLYMVYSSCKLLALLLIFDSSLSPSPARCLLPWELL